MPWTKKKKKMNKISWVADLNPWKRFHLRLKNRKDLNYIQRYGLFGESKSPFDWYIKDDPLLFMGRYLFPICVNKKKSGKKTLQTNLFNSRQLWVFAALVHAINLFVGYCVETFFDCSKFRSDLLNAWANL